MAKIFRLNDLHERKRLLLAESEIYRQTLKLEVQNIRLYSARVQKKFAFARLANPLFLLAGSLLGSRFFGSKLRKKRRGKLGSLFGLGLMAWRLFRNYGPLMQTLISARLMRARKDAAAAPGDREPAARI